MANQSNNPKKQDKEDTKNKKPCGFFTAIFVTSIILFVMFIILFVTWIVFFGVLLFCQNTETSNYSVKIICCTVLAGLAMILSAIIVCFVIHSKKDNACKIDSTDVLLQAYSAIFEKGDKSDPPDGDNENPQK